MAFKKKRKPRGRPRHNNPNATARRASIDPVIRALIAWRRQRQLSQLAAAAYAQAHGFPLTASSIRMWEEGWRRPRPHTLALLRAFLDKHSGEGTTWIGKLDQTPR
jgi:DNA-binding transcriptional regulator YiaG